MTVLIIVLAYRLDPCWDGRQQSTTYCVVFNLLRHTIWQTWNTNPRLRLHVLYQNMLKTAKLNIAS